MNPPANPRKGVATALIVAALVALATVVVVSVDSDEAEAAPLRRFTSCAELETWGAVASGVAGGGASTFDAVGGEVAADSATSGAPSTTMALPESAGADGASTRAALTADEAEALDDTNVVVEGVDELDLIDRLPGERLLVASQETLAIVDLGAPEVLDRLPIGWGTQITYDGEAGRAWLVGSTEDGAGVEVRRVDVGDGSLAEAGSWSTPGQLVDARRVGDRLHVVASDGFWGPRPIPFEDGPVPCTDVLHPEGPSDPSATLLVTLPVTGDLEPTAATEVVGSGSLVHVTTDAAYLATPTWSSATPRTGIHRFDLDDLTHTGSGSVEGALLNDFSMSDHDGHLRVATTVDGGCCWGGPAVGGRGVIVDDVVTMEEPAMDAVDPDLPEPSTSVPTTSAPETTVPETTMPETTTTEVAPATTTTTTAPIEPPMTIAPEPIPEPEPAEGLNRIVVLDTEGDLDVVGETDPFGHPGETLHGIRFVGDVAYAVTFLQTDPFYAVDLADPTSPTVVGEVELPGFNAYLHPVGDDAVVGFGPGEDGRTTAELFDVSDPTAPRVAGSIVVGDDSPVTYDHHAFTDLGDGRFAVPAADWSANRGPCPEPGPAIDVYCEPGSPASDIVTLEVDGDELREVERRTVTLDGYQQAARALPAGDGWAVLGETQVVVLDGAGDEVGRVSLT